MPDLQENLDALRRADRQRWAAERRGHDEGPPPGWEDKLLAGLDDRRMRALPVSANCSTKFHATHDSGLRAASAILYVCLHCTQGDTALGAASWFQDRRSKGSAQLCVDAGSCYRTLSDLEVPWAAPMANTDGWHIELAGYAEWTRAQWLAHHGTIYRAAYKVEFHAKKYGVPLRYLTDAQLRAGNVKGIITHAQVTRVFGGTHTDPGERFPLDVFLQTARSFANS
jgi:hypothetical protein